MCLVTAWGEPLDCGQSTVPVRSRELLEGLDHCFPVLSPTAETRVEKIHVIRFPCGCLHVAPLQCLTEMTRHFLVVESST